MKKAYGVANSAPARYKSETGKNKANEPGSPVEKQGVEPTDSQGLGDLLFLYSHAPESILGVWTNA